MWIGGTFWLLCGRGSLFRWHRRLEHWEVSTDLLLLCLSELLLSISDRLITWPPEGIQQQKLCGISHVRTIWNGTRCIEFMMEKTGMHRHEVETEIYRSSLFPLWYPLKTVLLLVFTMFWDLLTRYFSMTIFFDCGEWWPFSTPSLEKFNLGKYYYFFFFCIRHLSLVFLLQI